MFSTGFIVKTVLITLLALGVVGGVSYVSGDAQTVGYLKERDAESARQNLSQQDNNRKQLDNMKSYADFIRNN